ncbi:Rossmann-like domain-containing protein [Candidatus Formimonas warabiya]|uniref:Putative heavy-metal chelation domain-containing protein n=1 Tax=Formimonas warabiya TaxID=1761012 RepID=A0A3G1KYU0_FORW1|nr:DUF364 domain-containing protein [Candidatus Formimonas warabiya]ATW27537.1 hypothetical protein DCMF_24760 [Candidatus Formimonas warabiya]
MKFYTELKDKMAQLVEKHDLSQKEITIRTAALTPEEAIGVTGRKDFPLLKGKEILMNAYFKDSVGQAFTDQPSIFTGSIEQLMELDLSSNNNRALFIASANAILKHLGLIDKTVHCKNEEPEMCARQIREWLKEKYGGRKIALVGFQPAILDHVRQDFQLRILDLNNQNIGQVKYGVLIEDGEKSLSDVLSWADVVLATGSTVTNGTILNFMDQGKEVFFYGTTIAGAAYLKGLNRLCFCAS